MTEDEKDKLLKLDAAILVGQIAQLKSELDLSNKALAKLTLMAEGFYTEHKKLGGRMNDINTQYEILMKSELYQSVQKILKDKKFI